MTEDMVMMMALGLWMMRLSILMRLIRVLARLTEPLMEAILRLRHLNREWGRDSWQGY
mgnify:CR=1 FL=1